MTTRELAWTDIPDLVRLEDEAFPDDAWSEASWWAELAGRPRRDYVVVTREGELAAYAGLDHGGQVADLMTITVAPAHRGAGLAHGLLDELEARAAGAGAEALMLEVRADNAAARALYDRRGYDVLNVRRGYYQPGNVDAVVMRKLLPSKGVQS
ncbi:ribosomal protein S18-alanine N-acetyltransferase [Knoellia sp. Soil729]|uniref:ribosomal protein S18-alanine N-acetyltransferase n=1 Tax=Knoellia sp. Soil729 TaxID=1736394 RepID=UPI0006FF6A43|nr:ribosomal protein S18-alanine N-acetyltransferase [Knoellia sp. Soil729]KRE43900.1 ribosomal-protein-alanine acetyltransferase [Knoellia sp. Soil729]